MLRYPAGRRQSREVPGTGFVHPPFCSALSVKLASNRAFLSFWVCLSAKAPPYHLVLLLIIHHTSSLRVMLEKYALRAIRPSHLFTYSVIPGTHGKTAAMFVLMLKYFGCAVRWILKATLSVPL